MTFIFKVTTPYSPIILRVLPIFFLLDNIRGSKGDSFDFSALRFMNFDRDEVPIITTTTTPKRKKKYMRRKVVKLVTTTVEEEDDCLSNGGTPCIYDSDCCLGECEPSGFCPTASELIQRDARRRMKNKWEEPEDRLSKNRNRQDSDDFKSQFPKIGRVKKVKPIERMHNREMAKAPVHIEDEKQTEGQMTNFRNWQDSDNFKSRFPKTGKIKKINEFQNRDNLDKEEQTEAVNGGGMSMSEYRNRQDPHSSRHIDKKATDDASAFAADSEDENQAVGRKSISQYRHRQDPLSSRYIDRMATKEVPADDLEDLHSPRHRYIDRFEMAEPSKIEDDTFIRTSPIDRKDRYKIISDFERRGGSW